MFKKKSLKITKKLDYKNQISPFVYNNNHLTWENP